MAENFIFSHKSLVLYFICSKNNNTKYTIHYKLPTVHLLHKPGAINTTNRYPFALVKHSEHRKKKLMRKL